MNAVPQQDGWTGRDHNATSYSTETGLRARVDEDERAQRS